MAERPFKNFFEARDALDAELVAGKLELSGPQNAVLRVLVEHALYKPDDPRDMGFVIEKVPGTEEAMGVEGISVLTGLGQTAVKTAISHLKSTGLISSFRRPIVAGGRKVNRVRVNWLLPETFTVTASKRVAGDPSEGSRGGSSYESRGDSSEGPRGDSSIYRKQELLQELPQESSSARDGGRGETQGQNPGGQAPLSPQEPGRASTVGDSLASSDSDLQLLDWDDPDDGGAVAEWLGVPVASIGQPFRDWFDGLYRSGGLAPGVDEDFLAVMYAAQDSKGKRSPVGYFQKILPCYIAELRSIGKQAFKAKHQAS